MMHEARVLCQDDGWQTPVDVTALFLNFLFSLLGLGAVVGDAKRSWRGYKYCRGIVRLSK